MSRPCCNQLVASGDEHIVIPMASNLDDEWLEAIMNEGNSSSSSSNNTPMPKLKKIPKVLKMLPHMESNKECYEPEMVSIGPYHHNEAKLQSFEQLKFRFTKEYVISHKPETSATTLYKQVADVADEARNCYDEDLTESFDDRAFTRMLFVDGCFIHFINICMKDKEEQDKMKIKMKMKMKSHDKAFVQRDLFLLENQLPFIVLNALMSMNSDFEGNKGLKLIENFIKTKMAWSPEDSLLGKVENFITKHVIDWKRMMLTEPQPQGPADHLLELLHRQLFTDARDRKIQRSGNIHHHQYHRRSAMELKMVGIRFRPSYRDFISCIAFKSTWTGGILILPKINIDDTTISLFRNLTAYEQCHNTLADYLWAPNYICFLESIIDSANDVKELKYAGIITSFLKNDKVVEVISEMAAGWVLDYGNTGYSRIMLSIEEYHSHKGKTRIASWIAEVMRDHFRSPWTAIAVLAALFALLLTAVQTYFAAFPHTDKCQESI